MKILIPTVKNMPKANPEFFRPGSMGEEYVQEDERCPIGFKFFSNFESTDRKVAGYRAQPDKYVVADTAFTNNGQLFRDHVAVFMKKEPTTGE